jgi:hypothetical protein
MDEIPPAIIASSYAKAAFGKPSITSSFPRRRESSNRQGRRYATAFLNGLDPRLRGDDEVMD